MAIRNSSGWLGVAVLTTAMISGAAMACEEPDGANQMRKEIISWINMERRAEGLKPLRENANLQKSTTAHACDMATRGFFAHEGPGGPDLTQHLRKAGYRYRAANENIAKTSSSPVDQVNSL